MARKKSQQLTDAEQEIMQLLWEHNEMSVKEIAACLSEKRPTAYTTAQTLCRILVDKDYAEFRKEGRAFLYKAKISQSDARKGALSTLLSKFFGNSPELLAQHLIKDTDIKLEDLESLQTQIDKSKD
ncbi:BlaI/MecI/CopY family transcriptional regulator [Alteromonas sp. ASW11-130]|uniref:BlaI/MecI/CopY family transcriptional regulator n=1 Tax=Alteromonas sp. ASW11-130 TaxID=3015775 RepID=UPI002241C862|nr:BlaI/MecI/CopY family transcriptional regulator [Alteromonas sp. ASW11-130]MCW8092729.1 BlaI/MecI/CopY family transcriptional regulator [Alteromonas sp. ASW11-130]